MSYKSQVYVPIRKDNRSFEERQRGIWDQVHNDLDRDFLSKDRSSMESAPLGGVPVTSAPGGRWSGAGAGAGGDVTVGGGGGVAGAGGGGGIWDDMHARMERRRREWEDEVDRMRKDFFKLTPTGSGNGVTGTGNGSAVNGSVTKSTNGGGLMAAPPGPGQMYLDDDHGDKKFRVSFDVSQFSPNEINVRTQDNKLIVHAKHEETGEGKNVSREFSRQIDIPKHVDPEKLQSTLSKDGILQVEAPVPAPSYEGITSSEISGVTSRAPPQTEIQPPSYYPQSQGQTHQGHVGGQSHALHMEHIPAMQQQQQQTSLLRGESDSGSATRGPPGFQTGPVLTEQDGTRRLKMTVEIGTEFRPDEVMVKTVDRKLQISAKHEEQVQGRTTMREFSKELELPDNVDPNSVTASMSDEGKLIIEAPISGYTQGSYQGKPGSTKQPEIAVSFK